MARRGDRSGPRHHRADAVSDQRRAGARALAYVIQSCLAKVSASVLGEYLPQDGHRKTDEHGDDDEHADRRAQQPVGGLAGPASPPVRGMGRVQQDGRYGRGR